jgi:hypothetical protein
MPIRTAGLQFVLSGISRISDIPETSGEATAFSNCWGLGFAMSDAEQLRNRATRLFALALKVREQGITAYSDELATLASEALDHAEEMESRGSQQQPQSDKSDENDTSKDTDDR